MNELNKFWKLVLSATVVLILAVLPGIPSSAQLPAQLATGDPVGLTNAVTPSTNAINLTNGWAHVLLVEERVSEVELEFVGPRGFYSCFEYRSDSEPPISSTNPNSDVSDGRWNSTCQNNSSGTLNIQATEYVDVRMVFGAERDERFDWTRFYVLPDTDPPVTTNVFADPNPVAMGASFTVRALVDDTGTGSSDIASAEYSTNGSSAWTEMDASDGNFDSASEAVEAPGAQFAESGIHQVCARGTDAPGNTGSATCTLVVVYDPSGGFVTGGGWIHSNPGALYPAVWNQDFSEDDAGWMDSDDAWYGSIAVLDAVATFEGDVDSAPFSRFDGYRSVWPGMWVAEIDVLLDPEWIVGQGFDYSVAATGSDGAHQRDFIFHVGVVDGYGLLVNGSNNADFSTNPYKLLNDNGGNYFAVTSAGWYTLQHVFRDASGHLAVDLNLLNADGDALWTATRETAADEIPGEVGGNRYAWFTHIDVDGGIDVDNHQLYIGVPSTAAGRANFAFVSKYKKGASTPTGATQFYFEAGNLQFFSNVQEWLVVNQNGSNAQFKGEGLVNDVTPAKFMLWAGDGDANGADDDDTFRIKIWEEVGGEEIVMYDNGFNQPISGGSIVIHTGGKGKAGKDSFSDVPVEFALGQNYPNPFNPATQLAFDLPDAANVRLAVFDVLGRQVALLADGAFEAGTHEVAWNAESMPSGVYLYRIEAGAWSATRRMMLLK